MPLLSVILPVYNSERYLREAIESILNQTFSDFELIIIDDRSTDNSLQIAESFGDRRIRIHINEVNSGRAASDNTGHKLATGEYFARMDSDDICHPQRFEKQIAYLKDHPDVNVVGSWMQNFGASSFLNKYPESIAKARSFTLFGLPVGNPSIILRGSLFREKGMYYANELRQTEDYDFFARYINELNVVTLPEALIKYRTYPDVQKNDILAERSAVSHQVRRSILERWGIDFSERELFVHNSIAFSMVNQLKISLDECSAWLEKIMAYNKTASWFDQQALEAIVADKWFYACYFNTDRKFYAWRTYYKHVLSQKRPMEMKEYLKFFIRNVSNF